VPKVREVGEHEVHEAVLAVVAQYGNRVAIVVLLRQLQEQVTLTSSKSVSRLLPRWGAHAPCSHLPRTLKLHSKFGAHLLLLVAVLCVGHVTVLLDAWEVAGVDDCRDVRHLQKGKHVKSVSHA
jgi:hypothetical protein